jgi:hypothetical protein
MGRAATAPAEVHKFEPLGHGLPAALIALAMIFAGFAIRWEAPWC